MQQNKGIFFGIIALAIVGVVGMYVVSRLIMIVPASPRVTAEIVVTASLESWVSQAAQEFNQANPQNQVKITVTNQLVPESRLNSQVTAWLAESTFVVEMARQSGVRLDEPHSVAYTPLAWGAFDSRLTDLNMNFNWENLHEQAIAPNSNLKIVVAALDSAEGLAALISATAAHLNQQSLSASDVSRAESWLTETFGDSARGSLQLGPNPAEALATRGASVGDVGVLALASWQQAKLTERSGFSIEPIQPAVYLDYPFVLLTAQQNIVKGQIAQQFRAFLLSEAQQSKLAQLSLERAGTPSETVQVDGLAVVALQRWAERVLR